jgi:hypothetical protein
MNMLTTQGKEWHLVLYEEPHLAIDALPTDRVFLRATLLDLLQGHVPYAPRTKDLLRVCSVKGKAMMKARELPSDHEVQKICIKPYKV